MQLDWIWQATLVFFVGTMILRVGGRKSISQMTISQTIVMIGLGSLLIQPVSGKGLLITFLVAAVLIILMIITEYLEIKVDFLETFFAGKSVIVIQNGTPNIKNLKKLRLSIDRLETRLRQAGISSIEDVKYATIEVSGQLGYELKEDKKPLTKEDLMPLMSDILQIKEMLGCNVEARANEGKVNNGSKGSNIFEEINNKKFEGNKNEP
jgi:uncharacterized membrane protein YcaP (DUF421 family)